MIADGVPAYQGERTWRWPASQRCALTAALALPVGLGALALWAVLSGLTGGHGPAAGWLAAAAAVVAWGWLAGRVWTQSATLTADTLVIRNVLGSERVPLAVISGLHFRGESLRVTATHMPAAILGTAADYRPSYPGLSFAVGAVRLEDGAYWSGRYCDADKAADTIAAAVGLPPLPSRKVRISRRLGLIMVPAGAASWAAGMLSVLTAGGHAHSWYHVITVPFVGVGPMLFGIGLRATIDHFFRRRPVD